MVIGQVAVRLYTLPRRRERSILISVLQTGHFSCRKPLAVPSLNARILLHFSQRTAALGIFSFSVDTPMQLLSWPALPGWDSSFPEGLAAPYDRTALFWIPEGNQLINRSDHIYILSISCSALSSCRPNQTRTYLLPPLPWEAGALPPWHLPAIHANL